MYKVRVEESFSAAHRLRGYKGKCERLHGHNWKVSLTVKASSLNKMGLVIDFTELKKKLKEVLKELDHNYINNLPYFKKHNPTSENIACYIYLQIKKKFKEKRIEIEKVSVWESETSSASYLP